MQTPEDLKNKDTSKEKEVSHEERKKQQQSDPQLTELKGYFDKHEKLEPELEDYEEEDKDKDAIEKE